MIAARATHPPVKPTRVAGVRVTVPKPVRTPLIHGEVTSIHPYYGRALRSPAPSLTADQAAEGHREEDQDWLASVVRGRSFRESGSPAAAWKADTRCRRARKVGNSWFDQPAKARDDSGFESHPFLAGLAPGPQDTNSLAPATRRDSGGVTVKTPGVATLEV